MGMHMDETRLSARSRGTILAGAVVFTLLGSRRRTAAGDGKDGRGANSYGGDGGNGGNGGTGQATSHSHATAQNSDSGRKKDRRARKRLRKERRKSRR
jgi:hypothetical protein